jgi:hypothetical protein
VRVRVILTGHKEAMDGLRRLGKAGPAVAKRVLPAAAERIVPMAQALCPKDTGRASRSIRTTRGIASATGRISISVIAGGTLDTGYVEELHEDVTKPHKNGQAKFIEVPFLKVAEMVPTELVRETDREARLVSR